MVCLCNVTWDCTETAVGTASRQYVERRNIIIEPSTNQRYNEMAICIGIIALKIINPFAWKLFAFESPSMRFFFFCFNFVFNFFVCEISYECFGLFWNIVGRRRKFLVYFRMCICHLTPSSQKVDTNLRTCWSNLATMFNQDVLCRFNRHFFRFLFMYCTWHIQNHNRSSDFRYDEPKNDFFFH